MTSLDANYNRMREILELISNIEDLHKNVAIRNTSRDEESCVLKELDSSVMQLLTDATTFGDNLISRNSHLNEHTLEDLSHRYDDLNGAYVDVVVRGFVKSSGKE